MARLHPYQLSDGKYVCLEYRTPHELSKCFRKLAKYFAKASPYATLSAVNIQRTSYDPDLHYLEVFVETDEPEDA